MSSKNRTILIAVVAVAIIAVGAIAVVFLAQPPAEDRVRYAFLLPGSITDSGWNAQLFISAQAAAEALDLDVTIRYGLGQTGVLSVYEEIADGGYDVIWGHTIQYVDPANQMAASYPDTFFVGPDYYVRNYTNVVNVRCLMTDGSYVIGLLAGALTNSGKIGYVGGFQYETMTAYANAFLLGANLTYFARTGNPVNLSAVWAGVWDDVTLGREAGEALIAEGVDAIAGRGNGMTLGVIQAASAAGIYMFGDVADQSALAMTSIVASNTINYTVTILNVEALRLSGGLNSTGMDAGAYSWGMTGGENVVVRNLIGFPDAKINMHNSTMVSLINAEIAKIVANGSYVPFIGSEELW